jgi:glycine cleavage system H lipoate-binding protein
MDALWNVVENAAILVAGLAVRFTIAIALLAVLVALLLPFVYAGEGVRRLWRRATGFDSVGGVTWRKKTYYSPAHAWLRARAGQLRMGLDDFAGRLLHSIDAVTLPSLGTELKVGDALVTVASGRRGVVIPSPVNGRVTRINRDLMENPRSLVDDPYGRGWIAEFAPASQDYRGLKRDEEARTWMNGEAIRLSHALEHATGILAADGGELVVPTHLLISEEQRVALEREFLGAMPVRVEEGV